MLEQLVEADDNATNLTVLRKGDLDGWLAGQPPSVRQWVEQTGFRAEPGAVCLLPGEGGALGGALAGLPDEADPWAFAHFPSKLPARTWRLAMPLPAAQAGQAALAWALAAYGFDRYKARKGKDLPRLAWPETADRARVEREVEAISLVRDLINTPAADMGPAELSAAADALAARFGAKCRVIVGDGLLAENYPAIHAVGRAAAQSRRPRLIDLRWGDEAAPKVTLVGKGVCFDTGGLDLKPSSNMKLMKKDMGGAAHVLGLASMIMAAGLKLRLRVLIPAVENSVSGESMRPLDVLATRKGLTVEVGNTDAEGRLILCDALAEASAEKPALLIDVATLTGAARSALGTDLPALFSNDDRLAADILEAGEAAGEPLWRLPLHKPYRRMIDSKVADLTNASDSPHAGAITAALFLQEFIEPGTPWAHLDIMAWNGAGRPGRPEGGEALALRALFATIARRVDG
ncbi:leucyl aminopeptidase family protein [Paramagnetospirillum magneticum]|uniref:Leucyl aminopeptidase n=1 Tax=Paramagnetospirillum magneticum (strain ATCC 700264 / AMB-1) TaxID=342108 RepID=Q2VZR4_PARM1|nr:leucyl aminopeptidase family protein [Paramagnetospirillum magneticum]BAE52911.1 Leucyl aminopeptidase [Paramagnetospirillum magneticum AMB-1]